MTEFNLTMNTRLFLGIFFLSATVGYGQNVTQQGRLTFNRGEYINRSGKKLTYEGVYPTGELNPLLPCTILPVNHVTSRGVAPVNKNIAYELAYSSITGTQKCWLMQNLGATNRPTAGTDNTEAAAGWYWQFGAKKGYQYTTSRTPSSAWPAQPLVNTDWTKANDPCTIELGQGWRLPTYAEWQAVDVVTSNLSSLFNSELKMHAAGLLGLTGVLGERGSTVHYWSKTSFSTTHARAYVIPTANGSATTSTNDKDAGFSIRCIRD